MSTASQHCRNREQRLQEGVYAAFSSGSRGRDPWILRSMRLHWHSNLSGKHRTPCDLGPCERKPGPNTGPLPAKTAASRPMAFRQSSSSENSRWWNAVTGHSPPPFSTGPPKFWPCPHPPFGHLLPCRAREKAKVCPRPSRTFFGMGEGGAKRRERAVISSVHGT